MKRLAKAIPYFSVFIVIGMLIQWISSSLHSDFVDVFLEGDLVSILLALLAINITTISVIMAKMQEMAGKGKLDYSDTIQEMRISVMEQVALVLIASILLILKRSSTIANVWPDGEAIFTIGLIAVFAYAIRILYNTGEGIFIIAKIENQRMLEKHEK